MSAAMKTIVATSMLASFLPPPPARLHLDTIVPRPNSASIGGNTRLEGENTLVPKGAERSASDLSFRLPSGGAWTVVATVDGPIED